MSVNCERGVRVYRAQPLQYAPGQLAALSRADQTKAKLRKTERKLAMKSRKLNKQRSEIADLENRLDKLESRRARRGYGGQSIVGVGFGSNFLSPQRTPGLNNGFFSGRSNFGGRRRGARGRGGQGRHHH